MFRSGVLHCIKNLTFACLLAACATRSSIDIAAMDEATFERELERRFQYPPPPRPPRLADRAAGQAADAAYFEQYPQFERAYSERARAEAQALAHRLAQEAAGLSHDEFVLRVSEIVALADNAHSHTGTAFQKNTRRVPIRAYWFPDGLYVLRAVPAYAHLLGARIDGIDGIPIERVYQRVRRYTGGAENWRRHALTPMFESPGLLHAAGVTQDALALSYSGVLADGRPFERRIEGEERGPAAPNMATTRLIYPAADDEPMQSFLQVREDGPVYLQSRHNLFWLADLPRDGLYIGLGYTADADEGPISAFLERTVQRIEAQHPRFAVVDLRTNTGGDFTTTYALAGQLPTLVEHVYVLTSAWTLSAAMHFEAALKQAAPDRVTLVGEPVGDRLRFWSEGGAFAMPNAQVIATYTAGQHNFGGPCRDLERCFWLSALPNAYPVRVRTLDPEIPAPLTFAAYRTYRDPAMEAVLAREAGRG